MLIFASFTRYKNTNSSLIYFILYYYYYYYYPIACKFRLYNIYQQRDGTKRKMDDTFRIIALQKRIVSPRDRVFFSGFPWNPNPVISSGRYIVAGNGIVHSNGHRFPAGVGEAGRGQRERERGAAMAGMILPIFGLILVRMCRVYAEGVLAPP